MKIFQRAHERQWSLDGQSLDLNGVILDRVFSFPAMGDHSFNCLEMLSFLYYLRKSSDRHLSTLMHEDPLEWCSPLINQWECVRRFLPELRVPNYMFPVSPQESHAPSERRVIVDYMDRYHWRPGRHSDRAGALAFETPAGRPISILATPNGFLSHPNQRAGELARKICQHWRLWFAEVLFFENEGEGGKGGEVGDLTFGMVKRATVQNLLGENHRRVHRPTTPGDRRMIPHLIPKKYRKPVKLANLNYDSTQMLRAPQKILDRRAPLVIGPLADPVFVFLRENFPERAHYVRWEDFLETWDFRIQSGTISLVADGTETEVRSVYVRSCEITAEYPHRAGLIALMHALSCLRQRRLGTMDLGVSNFSKIHQLHSVIRVAATGLNSISVPETSMIKSFTLTGPSIARMMGSSVVKSLSSLRTEVFDDRRYRYFTHHRPADVPVLVQKKITGMEVRVHSLLGRTFPLGIRKISDKVDYRYDCDVELIHDLELTADEIVFCRRLHEIDGNPWIGVDLIRDGGVTYCFEANPNPGWACFDYEDATKLQIARALFDYLEEE
ncbi:MAG: hypothetical protein HC902_03130 [Calothrix sp. SM1_5_4]|nr:hypothetical protein [Calothrix sp. SM1_5_4]